MSKALDYIHSLNRFGIKPGLERITLLLKLVGNPQNSLQCVQVAGTNGKGSVCCMLSNIFRAAGKKTGLFISPYVVCFNERIQINGEYIPTPALEQLCERLRPAAEQVAKQLADPVTEFEFITALAFLWFYQNGCEVVVLETGLGGRLDSTNVVAKNLVSVITKINLDHTRVLGSTVAQIAGEKCGIIKPGSAVISSNEQLPEAEQVILQAAAKQNNRLILANTKEMSGVTVTPFGSSFCYCGLNLKINLPGRHQLFNAAQSVEAALYLGLPKAAIVNGLAAAQFPCRLEVLQKAPLIVIDGAHNPDGAETLAAYLKEFNLRPAAVVGMMADKDCTRVLQTVVPLCAKLFTVTVQANPRSLPAEQLAALAKNYAPGVTVAKNYGQALQQAFALQQSSGCPVVLFGSLYLAADLRPLVQQHLKNAAQNF